MRVAIVTVFNEYFNYGSFLQAFALQEYLRQHDIKAYFIEESSIKKTLIKTKRLLTKNLSRLSFNIHNASTYYRVNKKLNSISNYDDILFDAVVLGSDEIWNLNNKTFEHSPVFFGENVQAKKRISYAPSANGMHFEDFLNYPEKTNALNRIEHLSARDPLTVSLVEKLTNKSVVEVLDPTFLIDWSGYEKPNTLENYILVYCYHFSVERAKLIEALAQELHAEIIVVGHFNETLYKAKVIDSFEFLGYVKNALAVITDSFHGTIFSIQYNKPFCSFVGENYKVKSVLSAFSLETRDASLTDNLSSLFEKKIDYNSVNQIMEERKLVSKEFLNNALDVVK